MSGPGGVKALVPSAITLSGAAAALLAMLWAPVHPYWACNAIIVAALCDMIDGRVARWLGAHSAVGAQLDSLVDVVAFGVAPALLAFHAGAWRLGEVGPVPLAIAPLIAFVGASAVRLALFNTGRGGADGFVGIPTPVAALLVTTMIMTRHELGWTGLTSPAALTVALVGAAVLMVAPVRFPAFKHFRSRAMMVAYFATMAVGVTLLLVRQPGGAVLLAFLGVYLARGLVGLVIGGGRVRDQGPAAAPGG